MAVEAPSSLIRQVQDVLRKEAGVPTCGPADPAPPGLPSFEDAVAGLDPSAPPYLRCKECWGALLRGLRSTVCVFCGAEQRREGPPMGISFSNTLGCRRLLQSLDLDGSEVVALNTEPKDSGKGREVEKDGVVLSSLLDIELRWPSEGEKVQSSSTNNAPPLSTLNLSGVDLDNFFSETKKEVSSSTHHVPDEILGPDKETESEDFGLFEELRPIDKSMDSVETKPSGILDSSGVWEAEFQSASSHVSATDPNSKDFFQDSFSSNYDSVTVEEQVNIESGVRREGKDAAFSSNSSQIPSKNDSWPLDDLWHTADSVVPSGAEQFSVKSNADDGELKPGSMAHDLAQTDFWPTSGTSISNANEKIQKNDDSFDDWQDFNSSGNAPDALSNSWTHTSTAVTWSNDELGVSSISSTDKLEDMDFGSFVQSDMLPGLSDFRKDSSKVDTTLSEAALSDRMNEWEKTEMNTDMWPLADKNEIPSSTQSPGNAKTDVQDLLSKMHDLSFMLENNLCIPQKAEPSD